MRRRSRWRRNGNQHDCSLQRFIDAVRNVGWRPYESSGAYLSHFVSNSHPRLS